jgi:hypothetical protein
MFAINVDLTREKRNATRKNTLCCTLIRTLVSMSMPHYRKAGKIKNKQS